ncbi:cobalt-precorrin-5B (C(1))-methyltransferase CbiD [Geoalkalibacter halelectricus]|uniref:cobalt-precorrin-5B (C(1))-methyltransferase CbiD n=1 Tax=Geoalkalibacter halelectricus TaxID=2847045 RepID=UPI00267052D7|nr:cobalt-precorrin-5B (C(1))-methyltransferase CbiD [Geoalkalibacter halelectricus]
MSEKAPRPLRSGFTTGACAAAAARGAALMLRAQQRVEQVDIRLPAGFTATFALHGQQVSPTTASCFVIKDAGDDPDVTHGAEIHAEVSLSPSTEAIRICGGPGIGRVTKPGLAVAVGEWAINPVPRRMIAEAVLEVFPPGADALRPMVTLSIPDGARRAEQTLNARLGILGGLSILGTTGVVRPISHQAWTDTLEVALDVARAAGCAQVVLSTGRSSEQAAQGALPLQAEAFIMMGDFAAHALEACHRKGFPGIVLAAQFAKLVKIACGHDHTHVRNSRLDLAQLATWARALDLDGGLIKKIEFANTAREVFSELDASHLLVDEVARRALAWIGRRAPGADAGLLLVDYSGQAVRRFGSSWLFAQGTAP